MATCPTVCDRLTTLHPESVEAGEARKLRASYEAAEGARLYPLLVKAENLLSECHKYRNAEKAYDKCLLRELAAEPDNALNALYVCGERDTNKKDKLDKAWLALTKEIGSPSRVEAFEKRWKSACEDGEYEKQTPKKPTGAGAPTAAKSATPVTIRYRCPGGEEPGAVTGGCMCGSLIIDPCNVPFTGKRFVGAEIEGNECVVVCPGGASPSIAQPPPSSVKRSFTCPAGSFAMPMKGGCWCSDKSGQEAASFTAPAGCRSPSAQGTNCVFECTPSVAAN